MNPIKFEPIHQSKLIGAQVGLNRTFNLNESKVGMIRIDALDKTKMKRIKLDWFLTDLH